MKTPVRPKCAPTRVQRLRPEGPPLPRRQRPRRKPRKQGKSRKRRKHRDDARPRSANGKTAATKKGERLRNRRLNPKPRAGRPRSVKLDIKSNRPRPCCHLGGSRALDKADLTIRPGCSRMARQCTGIGSRSKIELADGSQTLFLRPWR